MMSLPDEPAFPRIAVSHSVSIKWFQKVKPPTQSSMHYLNW